MLSLRNCLTVATTMFTLVMLAVGPASAQETCITARSSAGPMLIESKAFSRANDRLGTAARNAEAQIRRAHAANGFVAGAVRYGRVAINCYQAGPAQVQKEMRRCADGLRELHPDPALSREPVFLPHDSPLRNAALNDGRQLRVASARLATRPVRHSSSLRQVLPDIRAVSGARQSSRRPEVFRHCG